MSTSETFEKDTLVVLEKEKQHEQKMTDSHPTVNVGKAHIAHARYMLPWLSRLDKQKAHKVSA